MANLGKAKKTFLESLSTDGSARSTERLSVDIILQAFDNDYNSPPASWNIKKMLIDLYNALKLALRAEKKDQVTSVCARVLKLLNSEPERFIEEFGEPIEEGVVQGKNGAYVWLDQLYSAVLVAQDDAPVTDILIVLLAIFKKVPEQFCRFLVSPVTENNAEISNGLLVLTQILSHVSQFSYKYPSRYLIADFWRECVTRSPETIGNGLYREMAEGSFKGKSPLYMVVGSIKNAAVDDPALVGLIGGVLIGLNDIHPESLIDTLGHLSESGPNKGKSSLHTVLTTLISSAYLSDKPEIADNLVNLLQALWNRNTEKAGILFTKPIEAGDAIGQNGVLMLVRALTTMFDNHMDPALLITLLDKIISVSPEGLAQALIQTAPDTRRTYDNVSALQQLINCMPYQPQVRTLVENMASSSTALQLMCSLPEPQRASFTEVLSQKHYLSPREADLLVKLIPNGTLTSGAGEDEPVLGDLLCRVKAGAYSSPFFSATADEPPSQSPLKANRIIPK